MRTLVWMAAGLALAAAATAWGIIVPSGDRAAGPGTLDATQEGLTAAAVKERLRAERAAVAEEFRQGQLADPAKVAKALDAFDPGAADTAEDNVARTFKVLAEVDGRFAEAHRQFAAGKYAEAAASLKALLADEQTTYQAAAKRLLFADALAKAGRLNDAAEAYKTLLKRLGTRFSFASLACRRLGQTYEKMERMFYAIAIYKWWLMNYAALDSAEARETAARVAQLEKEYGDPLNAVAGHMDAAGRRLEKSDSGRETQEIQRRIVAMLDDLIKTAEENAQSSSGQGQSQGQGQGQAQAQGRGPPRGTGIPSSPATQSALVGGETVRPHDLGQVRPSDASDDWGRLKPRERQALIEAFREMYPERYREMLEAYYKSLSEAENRR